MEEAEYQQRAAELALRLAQPDIRQVRPPAVRLPRKLSVCCCRKPCVISCVTLQTTAKQMRKDRTAQEQE